MLEQAPRLTEVGAGIQLSPNGTRILDWLGSRRRWRRPPSSRRRTSFATGGPVRRCSSCRSARRCARRSGLPISTPTAPICWRRCSARWAIATCGSGAALPRCGKTTAASRRCSRTAASSAARSWSAPTASTRWCATGVRPAPAARRASIGRRRRRKLRRVARPGARRAGGGARDRAPLLHLAGPRPQRRPLLRVGRAPAQLDRHRAKRRGEARVVVGDRQRRGAARRLRRLAPADRRPHGGDRASVRHPAPRSRAAAVVGQRPRRSARRRRPRDAAVPRAGRGAEPGGRLGARSVIAMAARAGGGESTEEPPRSARRCCATDAAPRPRHPGAGLLARGAGLVSRERPGRGRAPRRALPRGRAARRRRDSARSRSGSTPTMPRRRRWARTTPGAR